MLGEHRNLLAQTITVVFPIRLTFENFVRALNHEDVLGEVAGNAGYNDAVDLIVQIADAREWIGDLVRALAQKFPNVAELTTLRTLVERQAALEVAVPTAAEPFDEVLLDGGRPFVNRRSLRGHLRDLTSAQGGRLLLVDGEPQSGKSYSYYLLNHACARQGFQVHQFKLGLVPKPDRVADEILRRMGGGAPPELPAQGVESAERWAEKLAGLVADAVRKLATPRFLLFDDFPSTPLPPETLSFLVRLATYADQELRAILRVVMVKFQGQLPFDLEDVALRDRAEPFTVPDMVAVLMQIAKARRWDVSETAIRAKVDEYEGQRARSLRERFKFLRDLVQTLGNAAAGQP
jgi:hypothetical protein